MYNKILSFLQAAHKGWPMVNSENNGEYFIVKNEWAPKVQLVPNKSSLLFYFGANFVNEINPRLCNYAPS